MKQSLLFFLSLLLFVGCTNNKQNTQETETVSTVVEINAENIYEANQNKIVLVMALKDGIPYSQGTGFFISPDTLITNFHVISGATSVNIKFSDDENIIKNIKVVKASPKYDLAILTKNSLDAQYMDIDSLGNERIGSKIYTIGNPRGLEGTISEGILSGKRINDDIEYIQITAPISPGNSGGPIINADGKAIGVATFTFNGSQNLNFGVPLKYITECIPFEDIPVNVKNVIRKSENGALTMTDFQKKGPEFNEFISLKNNTDDVITSVSFVIVYKRNNEVIDYATFDFNTDIEPGLARRFQLRSFDQDQDWEYYKDREYYSSYKSFDIELRILSYTIDE